MQREQQQWLSHVWLCTVPVPALLLGDEEEQRNVATLVAAVRR